MCGVGDPDRKGKVETRVDHAKKTPLKGQRFESLEQAQTYLDHSEARWADTRIHGTTKRQVAAMFSEEKPTLLSLSLEPFSVLPVRPACCAPGWLCRGRGLRDSQVFSQHPHTQVRAAIAGRVFKQVLPSTGTAMQAQTGFNIFHSSSLPRLGRFTTKRFCWSRAVRGNGEEERRTVTNFGLNPYASPVSVHNLPANRQSEAAPEIAWPCRRLNRPKICF